ncbi:MAG: 2,3-bisphosphoglycerate-dependent phosphoglycerate mutase [Alphaproteobacteria bacterium]|nr:MAG: 2,3-bisphosphoglycerate-dependent phosphoglycerate mutase [Alphaproteobacteria bacterium]
MPKLVIFRHGETEWNERGLLTGRADIDLTELGREQAFDAGRMMRHIRFDRAYSSTLSRAIASLHLALDASAPINDHLKDENGNWLFHAKEDLQERDIGKFSGQPNTGEVFRFWPKSYEERIRDGESTKDMVERVEALYRTEIRPAILDGENVLVVAHAGVLIAFKVILGYLTTEQAPQPKERVPNAVPWVIEFDTEGRNLKDYLIQA